MEFFRAAQRQHSLFSRESLSRVRQPPGFAASFVCRVGSAGCALAACHPWQAAQRGRCPFQHKVCACPDCEALAGSRSWRRGGLTYVGDAGFATRQKGSCHRPGYGIHGTGQCFEKELLVCGPLTRWHSQLWGPTAVTVFFFCLFCVCFFKIIIIFSFFSSLPSWFSQ